MTRGDNTVEGVAAFTDQEVVCGGCERAVRADTLLDTDTSTTYFRCPECGRANKTESEEHEPEDHSQYDETGGTPAPGF